MINPFTVMPNLLYNDFYREKYVRNKISFPITIPVHFWKIYHPNKFYRSIKVHPTTPNYAVYTGNEILLSLS
jgi:hypothetical protein